MSACEEKTPLYSIYSNNILIKLCIWIQEKEKKPGVNQSHSIKNGHTGQKLLNNGTSPGKNLPPPGK